MKVFWVISEINKIQGKKNQQLHSSAFIWFSWFVWMNERNGISEEKFANLLFCSFFCASTDVLVKFVDPFRSDSHPHSSLYQLHLVHRLEIPGPNRMTDSIIKLWIQIWNLLMGDWNLSTGPGVNLTNPLAQSENALLHSIWNKRSQ